MSHVEVEAKSRLARNPSNVTQTYELLDGDGTVVFTNADY